MKNRWIFIPTCILLILVTLTMCVPISVARTLSTWEVGRAFVLRMNDVIYEYYDDIDVDKAVDMQNKLLKENSLTKITEAYAQRVVISSLQQTTIQFPDSESYIKDIVEETYTIVQKDFGKKDISEDRFKDDLTNQCEEAINSLQLYSQSVVEYSMNYRLPVILYSMVSLDIYRNVYGISFLILLWVTYYVNKDKKEWFQYTSKMFMLSGTVIIVLGIISNRCGHYLSNHYLGRTIDCIVSPFVVGGGILIVGGMIVKIIHHQLMIKSRIS